MSESRVFMLNGTEVQAVVDRLETFLHTEKGMEVQSSQTADGYVMQASQPKDGWKTLTGMRLAVTIQLTVFDSQLNVTVGEGQWADKIGAGALGLFIAWPLAITAGMGAFKQKKLPDEISERLKTVLFQADVLPFTAERNIRHTLQPKQWRARNAAHNCLSVQSSATNAERSSAMYARAAVPKSFKGVCSAQTADKSYNKIKMFICERVDMFCQPVCNYINARVSTNHLPSSTKKSRV